MNALDHSHHLSKQALSRPESPFQDLLSAMEIPDILGLAGGLPHPSLFPLSQLTFSSFPSSTVLDPSSPTPPFDTKNLLIPHSNADGYSIMGDLQYTSTSGSRRLIKLLREYTQLWSPPAYSDWTVLLNHGGTDGWHKTLLMLVNDGDNVLCEERIYPTAQSTYVPMGCRSVPIKVDEQGMLPSHLESTMSTWQEAKNGPRPRIMYLVPVGQNPLGSTMGYERRKEIYEACVKWDIIIVEDDPYTALQYEPWVQGEAERGPQSKVDVKAFLEGRSKSFLMLDREGRVVRLDTFSKVIAPGSRLGWFTCNPRFARELLLGGEVQTHAPCGFSQMIIGRLLEDWGVSGYIEWMANLKEQYRVRRDWMLNALSRHFKLITPDSAATSNVYAYSPSNPNDLIFTFTPPRAGMFLWLRVNYSTNPLFKPSGQSALDFEKQLWKRLIKGGVVVGPGWYYTPLTRSETSSVNSDDDGTVWGNTRLSFSYETKNGIEQAIGRFAKVIIAEWAGETG